LNERKDLPADSGCERLAPAYLMPGKPRLFPGHSILEPEMKNRVGDRGVRGVFRSVKPFSLLIRGKLFEALREAFEKGKLILVFATNCFYFINQKSQICGHFFLDKEIHF
jgi:hypothetical protein